MASLTHEEQEQLDGIIAELTGLEISEAAQNKLNSFSKFLVASEDQIIDLMNVEPPPSEGVIEFGMVLHWIHYDLPDSQPWTWIKSKFPDPQITQQMLAEWQPVLEGEGRVYGDGTLVGYGTYEQLDKGWMIASVLYIISILTDKVPKATFNTNPAVVEVPSGQTTRIAIVGDWGTGHWSDQGQSAPSELVMNDIKNLKQQPDYTIHLGDVYYAGMGNLTLSVSFLIYALAKYVDLGNYVMDEEAARFANLWHAGVSGTFTLNSNHEMYSGAQGYFADALGAPSNLFKDQQNTSYFAIKSSNWAIVGLDSAFFTHSLAYMEGRLLDEPNGDIQQKTFVDSLNLGDRTTIAMTHHTGMTYDAKLIKPSTWSPQTPTLWDDMKTVFNGTPDYWYWGHIHNAIVYTESSPLGQEGTLGRCVGHGAIPFGNAYVWGADNQQKPLDSLDSVSWYSNTPMPNPDHNKRWDNRVLNGWSMLTLTDATITEEFFEQGNPRAVKTISNTLNKV